MKDSNATNSPASSHSAAPKDMGFSPWQRLKTKRISYLTLPLLIMATVTEFVILATGWKYQQVVCLPQGMGVTFFGIGPIGSTTLAVEVLKRNDEARQDAISLTDYQKKELSEVEARQATIIQQFNADTAQLTREISDLRVRRETEVSRASKWNVEEARIENAFKEKTTE